MLRLLIFLAALAVVSPSLFAQTFQGTGSFSLGMSRSASNATFPDVLTNLGIVVTAKSIGMTGNGTTDDGAALSGASGFGATDSRSILFADKTYNLGCHTFVAASAIRIIATPRTTFTFSSACEISSKQFSWPPAAADSGAGIYGSPTFDLTGTTAGGAQDLFNMTGGWAQPHFEVRVINAPIMEALLHFNDNGASSIVDPYVYLDGQFSANSNSVANSCITVSDNNGTGDNVGGYYSFRCINSGNQFATDGATIFPREASGWAFGAGVYMQAADPNTKNNLILGGYLHDSATTLDFNGTHMRCIENHGTHNKIIGVRCERPGGEGISNWGQYSDIEDNTVVDPGQDGTAGVFFSSAFDDGYVDASNNANFSYWNGNRSIDSGVGTMVQGYDLGDNVVGVRYGTNQFEQPIAVVNGYIDNGSGAAGTTLTVTSMIRGNIRFGLGYDLYVRDKAGQVISGTQITAEGTGAGTTGTYTVSNSQLIGSIVTPVQISIVTPPSGALDTGNGGITDPAGTASATLVMMGLRTATGNQGIWFYPTRNGRISVTITGDVANDSTGGSWLQGRWNTVVMNNGAALSGNACGAPITINGAGANKQTGFSVNCIVNEAIGKPFVIDLGLGQTGGAGNVTATGIIVTARE